jgi:hypothetical protein
MSNYPDGFGSSPWDYGSQSPLDTEEHDDDDEA